MSTALEQLAAHAHIHLVRGLVVLCVVCSTAHRSNAQALVNVTSIELRTSVRAHDSTLTIGHVARVTGPRAEIIGAIRLHNTSSRVGLGDIRSAIVNEIPGMDWGSVVLRGSACNLVNISNEPALAPSTDPRIAQEDRVVWKTAGMVDPNRLIGRIAHEMCALADMPTERVRIGYDAKDMVILDTSTLGRIVQIQCSSLSDKTQMRVRIYAGERTILDREIRVLVELRAPVARTNKALRPRHNLSLADFTVREEWYRPSLTVARSDELVDTELRTGLGAGAVVRTADVKPARVIERGDTINVRCISGTVVVEVRARALSDAQANEHLELETLEPERSLRRRLHAVAQGRGKAVIVAHP